MKRDLVMLLAMIAAVTCWTTEAPKSSTPTEFDYTTLAAAEELSAFTDLRLVNSSTEVAHAMWKSGQLRIPDRFEAGAGIVSDFNRDGVQDRALPVRTERSFMLLVFSPANSPSQLHATIDYLTEEQATDIHTVSELARRPWD